MIEFLRIVIDLDRGFLRISTYRMDEVKSKVLSKMAHIKDYRQALLMPGWSAPAERSLVT